MLLVLPEPISLEDILRDLRYNLGQFPTAMLGEVGLDRAARIPVNRSASPVELTSFMVSLNHQLNILEAQIDLAVELGRNISLHSVRSTQATLELLSKMQKKHKASWSRVNIDLHSCGLSLDAWKSVEVSIVCTPKALRCRLL